MIKYELVNFCEFDKYATQSYCAIHNVDPSLNLGDITKVNEKEIADFNMMTWGFPCQDISIAGEQKGVKEGETRSGLYYEGLRILKEKKPTLSIIENVKNLTGKKFKTEFEQILKDLDEAGYNTYWKVLNAKDYGILQDRERVFIVSIRKDIDNGKFEFPNKCNNNITFKDFLDKKVHDKYYKSNIFLSKNKYENFKYNKLSVIKLIDNGDRITHRCDGLIYTLTASGRNCGNNQYICDIGRVLTPFESFKFMGFDYLDCEKCMNNGISDTQLYKQAGNSIVVDVLYYILLEIYKAMPYLLEDIKLSSFFSGIGAFEKAIYKLMIKINKNNEELENVINL